jgi:uncharacterized protein YbjT (DUF2867 family)
LTPWIVSSIVAFLVCMTSNHLIEPVLVLGGTGKSGRRVADRLTRMGVPVRVGSRTAATPFRWEDPATWSSGVSGVRAAYVCYHPDLAVPGAAETVSSFARVATDAGVQRLVLLSGRGETEAERAEDLVRAVSPGTTVARCSFFAQNFSEGAFLPEVLDGALHLPVGQVREPFVDLDDVADVAVAALTDDRHAGQLYELTGPDLLTFDEALAEVSVAAGRPVQLRRMSPEAYAAAARGHGVPEEVLGLLMYLFTEVLDGRNASVTDGVERALGQAPRPFRAFAENAARGGAWQVPATAISGHRAAGAGGTPLLVAADDPYERPRAGHGH